jgi:putative SOS response-associated peptidase YedK/ActR/RegA family two-component response regulator
MSAEVRLITVKPVLSDSLLSSAVWSRCELSISSQEAKVAVRMVQMRKKILCIEDDRETARLIAEELSGRGFHPLIAYDGRVGLSAIQKRIPDLVLCDVGLPEMSGFEVLAHRNELPLLGRVPFIFLTGATAQHSELQGRNLGADDYLAKPIDFDILEMIIRVRLAGGIARHGITNILMANGGRKGLPGGREVAELVEVIDAPMVHPDLDKSTENTALERESPVRNFIGPSREGHTLSRFERQMPRRLAQDYNWTDMIDLYGSAYAIDESLISLDRQLGRTGMVDGVRLDGGRRVVEPMRWGLIPNWWQLGSAPANPAAFYANADLIATAPFFRSAFTKRHCLIPASGFYELDANGRLCYFTRRDGSVMTIAGLWDEWRNPDTRELVRSCAAVVSATHRAIVEINGFVPVMLEPEHFELWLSGQPASNLVKFVSQLDPSRCLTWRPVEMA